jgi:single-strand DNA-binding protein
MASVNKVILLGNCGRDPEVRYLPSGQAVANVSIATSSRRKDRNSGEMVEDTQWHRVTFYDRLAEIAGEYVKKGRPLYVEGRIKYGKYTDQSGVEKNTVDIIATELQLLGGREGMGGGGGMGGGDEGGAPAPRAAAPRATAPAPRAPQGKSGFEDMDDDIPPTNLASVGIFFVPPLTQHDLLRFPTVVPVPVQ